MDNTLVIGFGNPLRGDDGVGWDAALAVRARFPDPPVRVLTVRQLLPELACELRDADRVVFVDAAIDAPPGAVQVREVFAADVASLPGFTHQCDPGTLLALAASVYGHAPEHAWLVTVGAARFDCEECLSATVQRALPEIIAQVCELAAPRREAGLAAAVG